MTENMNIKSIDGKSISDGEILLKRPIGTDYELSDASSILTAAAKELDIISNNKTMAYEKYGIDNISFPRDTCSRALAGYRYMLHNALVEPDSDVAMKLMLRVLKELYRTERDSIVFHDKNKFMQYLDEGWEV